MSFANLPVNTQPDYFRLMRIFFSFDHDIAQKAYFLLEMDVSHFTYFRNCN